MLRLSLYYLFLLSSFLLFIISILINLSVPLIIFNFSVSVFIYYTEAYSLTLSRHNTVLRWGVDSTSPNPQAGGPPPVGCPRLLIQYILIYLPYCGPGSSVGIATELRAGRSGDRIRSIMSCQHYEICKVALLTAQSLYPKLPIC